MKQTSRRKILKSSLGFAGSAMTASALQLGYVRQAAASGPFNDYKAMVCILLAGGNDSFNMIVPDDDDQHAQYQMIRSDLALARSDLLPLSGTTLEGRSYAVHPGMPEVQALYDTGELAVVANVGPLIDYVDAAAVASGAPVPLGVFSHSDQIQTWQTGVPYRRIAQGWGGRLADVCQEANLANGISMNISLSGSNVFQSGEAVDAYAIESTGNGAPGISAYDDGTDFGAFRKRMIDDLLSSEQENLLRREYRQRLRNAIDAHAIFVAAMEAGQPISTQFGGNQFSQALRQIARVISARDGLGVTRQTFFVTLGGWDHHDDVLVNQAAMLPTVATGLREFRDALQELGVFDAVTTFTTSDFGRTMTSNGKGSDHGWGGHHLVMGGSVNGGRFYGEYPELSDNSPLDVGRGIYVPTTPVDEYFADLALWFGLAAGELEHVLPNIRTFYSPESGDPPLGMLI